MGYFSLKNAVFYPCTVGFSMLAIDLFNLILCISGVNIENTWGTIACIHGYWNDCDMVFYLGNLTKVGSYIEGGGLLGPPIFRWAVGACLEYVIVKIAIFIRRNIPMV